MSATFLRNQWYVAATSAEIRDKPLGRTICNEPVVIFRDGAGKAAILGDRCPHRKAPLSQGQVVEGDIECPYHGIRFDSAGACTLIPTQERIPRSGFEAQSYASVEKHDLIFMWIGDAALADPALIPDWSANTSPDWTTVHGYHHVRANYQLLVDNLLDLSHLAFVHRTTLGASGPSDWLQHQEVMVDGDVVRTRRVMRNVAPSGLVRAMRRFTDEKIDRFQESEFYLPSYVLVILGSERAGERDDMDKPHHLVIDSITPETETTSHYFWSVPRRHALDDTALSKTFYNVTKGAFDEDAAMIEAQQRLISSDPAQSPLVNLDADGAAAAARRIVTRKLREQAATAQAAE